VLGALGDGALLTAVLGQGDGVLVRLLGPRYPAILPVILSLGILVSGTALGWIFSDRNRGIGESES
jgi:hypothetical protein